MELDATNNSSSYQLRRERLKARLLEAKFWERHHTWTSKTDGRVEYLQAQLNASQKPAAKKGRKRP